MSNIITSGSIAPLLWPGLDKIGNAYKYYENEYKPIFTRRKSNKAEEVSVDIKDTGYALHKPEGAQIAADSRMTTYKYYAKNLEYALGYSISSWAIKNNQYENEFNTRTRGLFRSYDQTKEVMAMNMFNQAFNPNVLIGNGQPLASPNHPYVGGTYANTFVDAAGNIATVDLSEASLEQALIQLQQFKDQAGMTIACNAKYLLVPTALSFTACRLTQSVYRVGTANNDINASYSMKAISNGYLKNHFLTSSSNYFLLSDIPDMLIYYDHSPFVVDMNTDPNTKTLTVNGVGAYSFMAYTPNGVFCCRGA